MRTLSQMKRMGLNGRAQTVMALPWMCGIVMRMGMIHPVTTDPCPWFHWAYRAICEKRKVLFPLDDLIFKTNVSYITPKALSELPEML